MRITSGGLILIIYKSIFRFVYGICKKKRKIITQLWKSSRAAFPISGALVAAVPGAVL
jgi:hypothetical protein